MRISFYTFGCRTNQSETEELAARFRECGWACVPFGDPADVVVVHTCTVTARSDAKARQLLRRIASEQPLARLVIAGCGVERDAGQFRDLESVVLTIGNKEKHRLPELLAGAGLTDSGAPAENRARDRTRPSVKIQEGCDCFCSYCIVPFVRGAPRSWPCESILEQIGGLVASGAKEIVLTGTHLGLYEHAGTRLADLVGRAAEIPGEFRLRISSLEPMGIEPRLIELVSKHPKVCPHLHISFQSFSDPVLLRMGRPNKISQASELLKTIHKANSSLRIGCDLIVGFPGETDELFEETCLRVEELPIHYGHVFRFSPRPKTVAAGLPGRLPNSVLVERSRRIRGILTAKHREFVARQWGQNHVVLVENAAQKSGFTENYLRVRIRTSASLEANRFYPVKILRLAGSTIEADPAENETGRRLT